jgi:cytochrome c biogenesis protein CcmG/thiol:disulfide interchange protein DsbE
MNVRWSHAVPLLVLALLVFAFWRGLGRDPTVVPSPLIGKPAPQFALPSLHDPAVTITKADLVGQPTLVNVWGTWCAGCRAEHGELLVLAARGVRIVGLDWKDDPAAARAWLAELGDPYQLVVHDASGTAGIDWGVYGAPETFVLDRKGVIRHKHIGPLGRADVEGVILPLLDALAKEAP